MAALFRGPSRTEAPEEGMLGERWEEVLAALPRAAASKLPSSASRALSSPRLPGLTPWPDGPLCRGASRRSRRQRYYYRP